MQSPRPPLALPLYRFVLALARLGVSPRVYWRVATAAPRALPRSVGLTRWSRPEWLASKRRIAALYVFIVHDMQWPPTSDRMVWYCGPPRIEPWQDSAYRDDDLPSSVWSGGDRFWGSDGRNHRDGGRPAAEYANGDRWWYHNGQLHRDGDQPAVELNDGSRRWYRHGKLYRDGDRPAVINADGSMEWLRHGALHRDGDKPAIVRPDGTREWYVALEWNVDTCGE